MKVPVWMRGSRRPFNNRPAAGAAPAAGGRAPFQPQGFKGSTSGENIDVDPGGGGGDQPPAPDDPPAGTATDDPPAGSGDDPNARPVAGHGGVIPPERITERIEREKRKWLKAEYGTDDEAAVEKIKSDRKKAADEQKARDDEYARLKGEEEQRKRDALSAEEKLKQDIADRDSQILALKTRITELETQLTRDSQDTQITSFASKYIDPDYVDVAKEKFRLHVQTLSEEELKKFDKRKIDNWFAKYAKDRPKIALQLNGGGKATSSDDGGTGGGGDDDASKASGGGGTAGKAPAARPPVRKVPMTTGAPPGKGGSQQRPAPRDETPDLVNGKTMKPGLPNSMNKQELNAELKKRGLRSW